MKTNYIQVNNKYNTPQMTVVHNARKEYDDYFSNSNKNLLINNMQENLRNYVKEALPLNSDKVIVIDSSEIDKYSNNDKPNLGLVDINPINFHKNINSFLFEINKQVNETSIFIGSCYIKDAQKKVKAHKKISNKLYKAEILGRLVYSGFSIIEFKESNGILFFMVMKVENSPKELEGASDKILFPMTRIGKNGKEMKVLKIRTMHPYSQYLQKYIVNMFGYNKVGKPQKDFRLTKYGKFIRKFWLDEIPQLINVLRGDMVLFGVRPLSKTRFDELPEDIKEMRIKLKPGCVPPYVALLMPDSEGNIEAERIYIKDRLEHGFIVDIKLFFKAIWNIITGKIVSS